MTPTNTLQNKLHRQGYKIIAGLDEAGRGSWAGPIVAAAVIFPRGTRLTGVKDSKQLTAKQREEFFEEIVAKASSWSTGIVSHRLIDSRGIAWAHNQAFLKAIKKLSLNPDFLLLDYFNLQRIRIPFESVVKGDQRARVIAAASILAKVTRDRILERLHKKYSEYGFAQHKGYGTKGHYKMISKHGVCEVHRRSFRPMCEAANPKFQIPNIK